MKVLQFPVNYVIENFYDIFTYSATSLAHCEIAHYNAGEEATTRKVVCFMKRLYIITGANGHLGNTIISLLPNTACEIRGLILPQETCIDHDNVHYIKGDVCDMDSLEPLFSNIEDKEVYVIHTAGIINIQPHVSPKLYQVNVNGTKNMLELSKRYHVKRFLYTSSVHAIPEKNNLTLIKEINHFSQSSVEGGYAKTKAEASQAVLEASNNGLCTMIVHPSGILGPNGNSSNHLVQMVVDYIQGKLPACVNGGYDFVDVRDVANGCLLALEKGSCGNCYILSNRYYEIKDVLAMAHQITGRRKLPVLPLWLAKAASPILCKYAKIRHQRPLYTPYTLSTLQSNSRFSHDKATKELGYYPRDLYDTIKDTIDWYYNHLNKH